MLVYPNLNVKSLSDCKFKDNMVSIIPVYSDTKFVYSNSRFYINGINFIKNIPEWNSFPCSWTIFGETNQSLIEDENIQLKLTKIHFLIDDKFRILSSYEMNEWVYINYINEYIPFEYALSEMEDFDKSKQFIIRNSNSFEYNLFRFNSIKYKCMEN